MSWKKNLILSATLLVTAILTKSAFAALPCSTVEIIGTHMERQILDKINAQSAGQRIKINKRKTLVIKEVSNLSFSGCNALIKANVKLKRKIRRDAIGNIKLKGKVTAYTRDEVCLSNVKVVKVNLSHTGVLGEAVYKAVANKVIKNKQCFSH